MAGNGIPKGWSGCPPMGDSIIAGKFIAFKTPLDKAFNHGMAKKQRFTPETILENVQSNQKRIGLWIDLTNTSRYYPQSIITNKGIKYFKLKCDGHGQVPTPQQVWYFMSIVTGYIQSQPIQDESLIAVHCTHGLNRTGYFICTFLAQNIYNKYPIQAAIAQFTKCRPPGIYRQIYLDHLLQVHALSGDPPYSRIPVTEPDWHSKETPVNQVVQNQNNADQPKLKKRRMMPRNKKKTMVLNGTDLASPVVPADAAELVSHPNVSATKSVSFPADGILSVSSPAVSDTLLVSSSTAINSGVSDSLTPAMNSGVSDSLTPAMSDSITISSSASSFENEDNNSISLTPSNNDEFVFVEKPRFFGEGFQTVLLGPTEAIVILKEIQELIPIPDGEGQTEFKFQLPFNEAENLTNENIHLLSIQEYMVNSYSATSVRYLLLIKSPRHAYFIDSYNSVFLIDAKLTFPHFLNYNQHIGRTLLDGHMKWFPGSDDSFVGFEIDDVLVFDDVIVTHLSSIGRRLLILNQILGPRCGAFSNECLDKNSEYLLTFHLPKCLPCPSLNVCQLIAREMESNLSERFKSDGLLFKPTRMPYYPGQEAASQILRWSSNSTASFEMKTSMSSPNIVELFVSESSIPFAIMNLTEHQELKDSDGKIVEVKFDESQQWVFCNLKSDVCSPYSFKHAQGAMKTHTKVDMKFLLGYIWNLWTIPRGYSF